MFGIYFNLVNRLTSFPPVEVRLHYLPYINIKRFYLMISIDTNGTHTHIIYNYDNNIIVCVCVCVCVYIGSRMVKKLCSKRTFTSSHSWSHFLLAPSVQNCPYRHFICSSLNLYLQRQNEFGLMIIHFKRYKNN